MVISELRTSKISKHVVYKIKGLDESVNMQLHKLRKRQSNENEVTVFAIHLITELKSIKLLHSKPKSREAEN